MLPLTFCLFSLSNIISAYTAKNRAAKKTKPQSSAKKNQKAQTEHKQKLSRTVTRPDLTKRQTNYCYYYYTRLTASFPGQRG